jgi:hypothetical protein
MDKYKQGDSGRGESSTDSGGRGKGHGGSKPHSRGGQSNFDRCSESASAPCQAGLDDECKWCGKKGR